MEGRYVLVRIFANKEELTGGEILAMYDNLSEIAESNFFYKEKNVKDFLNKSLKYRISTDDESGLTYDEAREQLILTHLEILERRLSFSGYLCSLDLTDLDDKTKSMLIKGKFGGSEEHPISFITLDTKYIPKNNESDYKYNTYMKFLREIKINSLDIKN